MDFHWLEALIILAVFVVYSVVIWGLTRALRKLGIPAKLNIVLGFLFFGVGAGLWAALAWPLDSITLINFPAVFLGDTLYQQSILYLGDPSSSQAHYTIPWFLRVPQVHFIASIMLWGLLGLVIQLTYNQRKQMASFFRCYHHPKTRAKGEAL